MFDTYFEAFLADNPIGKEIHYRIRYQVYCLETGWEDAKAFPDGLERDSYDDHSVHFIVRARATGDWIAAMRLVVAPLDQLPLTRLVSLDKNVLKNLMSTEPGGKPGLSAEISRLCVVSQYRRRAYERNTPYQVPWNPDEDSSPLLPTSPNERRKAPWLKLGLIRAARDYSEENGIQYWFFLIADPLARILDSLGMGLQLIGPPVEHRGIRRPYLRDLKWGYRDIPAKSRELFEMLSHSTHFRLFSELKRGEYKLPARTLAA
ncbi:MAG TPA: PEP-CTERM/exosortase system-associated acyltransferase [Candidatus Acidoferrales bacterium]|nr:PEP-CTERM/exosortase system-associated acyltransferase [Candidatus Acidoferrales bacterium]